MQTLQLDDKTARKIYPTAIPELKTILENSFPENFFKQSIIDRTPTVEAALAIAGTSIEKLTRPDDAKHETACRIIEAVIDVLREGVEVDHSNSDQTKYEPRFIYKSGLGLSFNDYAFWHTYTYCGPRLCYLSYDTMVHGVKILDKYYNDYLNSKK